MALVGFSLSVANRGNDFTIGGAGVLDDDGMLSLRKAIEDSCSKKAASIALDLMEVTDLRPETIAALVAAAGYCRERGVPLSMRAGETFLKILLDAGFGPDLLPVQ